MSGTCQTMTRRPFASVLARTTSQPPTRAAAPTFALGVTEEGNNAASRFMAGSKGEEPERLQLEVYRPQAAAACADALRNPAKIAHSTPRLRSRCCEPASLIVERARRPRIKKRRERGESHRGVSKANTGEVVRNSSRLQHSSCGIRASCGTPFMFVARRESHRFALA
jgi:hypothetical protein